MGKFQNKLVFFIKDNHCYPITDERLKVLATEANQGGVDNLWKFLTDMDEME